MDTPTPPLVKTGGGAPNLDISTFWCGKKSGKFLEYPAQAPPSISSSKFETPGPLNYIAPEVNR